MIQDKRDRLQDNKSQRDIKDKQRKVFYQMISFDLFLETLSDVKRI